MPRAAAGPAPRRVSPAGRGRHPWARPRTTRRPTGSGEAMTPATAARAPRASASTGSPRSARTMNSAPSSTRYHSRHPPSSARSSSAGWCRGGGPGSSPLHRWPPRRRRSRHWTKGKLAGGRRNCVRSGPSRGTRRGTATAAPPPATPPRRGRAGSRTAGGGTTGSSLMTATSTAPGSSSGSSGRGPPRSASVRCSKSTAAWRSAAWWRTSASPMSGSRISRMRRRRSLRSTAPRCRASRAVRASTSTIRSAKNQKTGSLLVAGQIRHSCGAFLLRTVVVRHGRSRAGSFGIVMDRGMYAECRGTALLRVRGGGCNDRHVIL
mmetsp:Transcript_52917/g.149050  ORF Transcript_52917/g.149050 Transcript_52917/m.149050 type:complete len:322 (-) Transcript_52917:9-974(-)